MHENDIDDALSKLFNEADDKLQEQPSSRAWNKLERRLETRVSERDRERVRLKGQFTRQMSVAAAVLATVLIAGIWATFHLFPIAKNEFAQQKVAHFNPSIEVKTNSDANGNINADVNNDASSENAPKTISPITSTQDNRLVMPDNSTKNTKNDKNDKNDKNSKNDLKITIQVKNTGKKAGDEVVQLYVSHKNAPFKTPIRALKGFQRIALNTGESRMLTFNLSEKDLSVIDVDGKSTVFQGDIEISVGGSQPSEVAVLAKKVVQNVVKIK